MPKLKYTSAKGLVQSTGANLIDLGSAASVLRRCASAPAIPIFLDELWGSIFSFERGRFFWKWPRKIPYRISVYFGAPIDNPTDVDEVRDAIEALGPVTESS